MTSHPRRCFNCQKALPSLLLGSRCRVVNFCDTTCQRARWQSHKVECRVLSTASTETREALRDLQTRLLDPNLNSTQRVSLFQQYLAIINGVCEQMCATDKILSFEKDEMNLLRQFAERREKTFSTPKKK